MAASTVENTGNALSRPSSLITRFTLRGDTGKAEFYAGFSQLTAGNCYCPEAR
jgi:hypothetical protein